MRYLCVFGNPIAHSLSPLLHNAILQSYKLPYLYGRFMLDSGENLGKTFDKLDLCGANITLPFKEHAYLVAHSLSPLAKRIGAVNTLVRTTSGKICGYNTDAPGFIASLLLSGFRLGSAKGLEESLQSKEMSKLAPLLEQSSGERIESALILGAGGSAKALACALQECGTPVIVANRSSKHEAFFTQRQIPYCLFDELDSSARFDLIINATSSSIAQALPLPESTLAPLLARSKLAYDLMYGTLTPFARISKECGTACKDGADMLILQALSALRLFCPQLADTPRIYTIMRSVFTQGRRA